MTLVEGIVRFPRTDRFLARRQWTAACASCGYKSAAVSDEFRLQRRLPGCDPRAPAALHREYPDRLLPLLTLRDLPTLMQVARLWSIGASRKSGGSVRIRMGARQFQYLQARG
jgi:hypothetical protein